MPKSVQPARFRSPELAAVIEAVLQGEGDLPEGAKVKFVRTDAPPSRAQSRRRSEPRQE
jgi:hypothetical protein